MLCNTRGQHHIRGGTKNMFLIKLWIKLNDVKFQGKKKKKK